MRFLQELRRRWWLVLAALIILVLLFATRVATFYTDVLWFDSVGFGAVFWTLLSTQVGIAVAAGLLMAVLLGGNLLLARRLAPPYRIPSAQEEGIERYRQVIEPFARPLVLLVALGIGILSGVSVAPEWETVLLWLNGGEFGRTDPQFGLDLGYFVFDLPFWTFVNSWLFSALLITIVLTGVAHYLFGGIRPQSPGQKLTPQVNVHLSLLLAALVAVRAWGFWLDRYMLSYSERGVGTGLSYTDVNAQLVALQLLAVIAAVTVVLFLLNIRFQGWLLPSAGLAILAVAYVLLSGVYPAVIQRFQVAPQELEREREFIERNLELTRFAYRLDNVTYEPFPARESLDPTQVSDNAATFESIRLWDPATLQNTYSQLQELRTYYTFQDVDVDRYTFGDTYRQAMVSVREIDPNNLSGDASTWENQRLVYTHGFGLVSSAVSTKRSDGQPVFFVRDIPPQGVSELEVENPRIYFGERSPEYSIVGTNRLELDFPREGENPERYTYTGEDGVGVGSLLNRLAFALRFAEPNIALTDFITGDSKVLFNRRIRDRVGAVAPFLKLDHDPYPVATEGTVKWVVDGYTTTNMIPYSERVDLGALTLAEQRVLETFQRADGTLDVRERSIQRPGISGEANYIRNSVKAVVDAYDGTVDLYVADPDDPVVEAWRRVFPDSFKGFEEAGDDLIAHFRYPEDMFRVQASVFETYHILEADEFYTKEDAWRIPNDAAFFQNQGDTATEQRQERAMRPYYLMLRLPGQDDEEFALIQPYTPAERRNLIAWLAGRSDPQHYGELKAYVMPPTRTVFGPEQIQARIDQDGAVAEQITLWSQSGARVIYGNLLVIPVEDALLYAQPLFLRAQQSDLPNLERVVLVLGDNVVLESTLTEGLLALFGDAAPALALPEGADDSDVADITEDDVEDGDAGDGDADDADAGDGGVPGDVDPRFTARVEAASQLFEDAEAALREGDLGRYQELIGEAQAAIVDALRFIGQVPQSQAEAPDDEPAAEPTEDGGEGDQASP